MHIWNKRVEYEVRHMTFCNNLPTTHLPTHSSFMLVLLRTYFPAYILLPSELAGCSEAVEKGEGLQRDGLGRLKG